MDVERTPGPHRVSDLSPTTIELFNKVKGNKFKFVRYQSNLVNFTTYCNGNVVTKGLLPKTTQAIHSKHPLFWSQWNQKGYFIHGKLIQNTVTIEGSLIDRLKWNSSDYVYLLPTPNILNLKITKTK